MANRRGFLKAAALGAAQSVASASTANRGYSGWARGKTRRIPVALIQFDSVPEQIAANLRRMRELGEQAAGAGARWIMFHEGTLRDYTPRVKELAEAVPNGKCTRGIIDLAQRTSCYISFGICETRQDRYHISQVFVGPSGFINAYRKTWLWHFDKDEGYRNEWARFDPGPGPELFDFDGVKATCFICADGEAPRCIERAAELKPELVFYPNNRGSLPPFEIFGARARTIGAPMLVTNRVGDSWVNHCQGGCVVYSKRGEVLAKANRVGKEEILYHTLELDSV